MSMSDPIADLATRLRNASKAKKNAVDIPASNLKREIIKLMIAKRYLRDVTELPDNKQGILRVYLRYSQDDVPVLKGIQRISTPGLRKYYDAAQAKVSATNTRGVTLISTSAGVMTNHEATARKIGGEVLLRCW